MKYQINILNQSKIEPITLEDAKAYLRLDSDYENNNLIQIIKTTREAAEQYLRCSLIPKELLLVLSSNVNRKITLPYGPVIKIKSIILYNAGGGEDILDPKFYILNEDVVSFKIDISHQNIKIIYDAGYQEILSSIKQGMLIHLVSLFESRNGDMSIPNAVYGLYQQYRKIIL